MDESNDIYQSFVGGLGDELDPLNMDNPGSPTKRVKQKVLATSHLKKQNRFKFFQKRVLTLTDDPQLFYYKPGTSDAKFILLNEETYIEK